jgi:hypothetical protein
MNPHERALIDWGESKDSKRYPVVGTSISREGRYSVSQFLVSEVESILVAPGHIRIGEDRTEHVTSRVSETVDRCVQKIVEGILRRRRHSVLFTVTFLEERTGTGVGS